MKQLTAKIFLTFTILARSAMLYAGDSTTEFQVKWYPGHYVTLASGQPRDGWKDIAGKHGFAGGQRIYTWRQLELSKDKYDFTAIEEDLAYLRKQNQKLILEVWDTTFDGHSLPVPDYLLGVTYGGGIARESRSVIRTKRWLPAVMDRYLLLMETLGKRFDRDPDFAGFIHTETAVSPKGSGFEDFKAAAYDIQMRRLIAKSRKAFPNTPVIVFGNWYPDWGEKGLGSLAEYAQAEGVGWGGPDLLPGKKIWGYNIIRANAGRMPLGLSAQWDSYKGTWTAQQLLDFAEELKLNFVFWGYFNRHKQGGLSLAVNVIPAVEANGKILVMQRPANLAQSKK